MTSGRARSALSSMYSWAMTQGYMGERPYNPVIATEKPKDAVQGDRVLTDPNWPRSGAPATTMTTAGS